MSSKDPYSLENFEAVFERAAGQLWPESLVRASIRPQSKLSRGDAESDFPIVLAKELRLSPAEIATRLLELLSSKDFASEVQVKISYEEGFLNLRFDSSEKYLLGQERRLYERDDLSSKLIILPEPGDQGDGFGWIRILGLACSQALALCSLGVTARLCCGEEQFELEDAQGVYKVFLQLARACIENPLAPDTSRSISQMSEALNQAGQAHLWLLPSTLPRGSNQDFYSEFVLKRPYTKVSIPERSWVFGFDEPGAFEELAGLKIDNFAPVLGQLCSDNLASQLSLEPAYLAEAENISWSVQAAIERIGRFGLNLEASEEEIDYEGLWQRDSLVHGRYLERSWALAGLNGAVQEHFRTLRGLLNGLKRTLNSPEFRIRFSNSKLLKYESKYIIGLRNVLSDSICARIWSGQFSGIGSRSQTGSRLCLGGS